MLPLILIFLATVASAIVSIGTRSDWILRPHGMSVITTSHLLQWPLTFLAILLCVALAGLVASGKRRIFWLLGLLPVGGLLIWHFHYDPMSAFVIADNPPFISATAAQNLVADDDDVVGLKFNDASYAYPFATLYTTPVILQNERGKRLLLIWSPFANRATALTIDRDIRARELDVVSMPANAILLYNSRLGEFINGLTAKTPKGNPITAVSGSIPTWKMTWRQWRTLHPDTQLLALPRRYATGLPVSPVMPHFPVPPTSDQTPPETKISFVNTTNPIALDPIDIHPEPLNLSAGEPLLLFRDRDTQIARAFDRHIEPDATAEFHILSDPKRPSVFMTDSAVNCGWSANGVMVDGDQKFRGKKLSPLPIEEDLYYGVMKYWYPQLKLIKPRSEAYTTPPTTNPTPDQPQHTPRKRRKPKRAS